MPEKVPGIIGGVGPEATVDLFEKVIEQTPAKSDQEHLQVLVFNNPKIPSRYDAIQGDGESPGPYIAETGKKLETMGADFLAIASNLTHYYYDDARQAVDVPILHLIETVVDWIQRNYTVENVGILAPTPTIAVELYQTEIKRGGLNPVTLDTQTTEELVDDPIYGPQGIKRGVIEENREPLERAVRLLVKRGAEVTILGCTELPLALGTTRGDEHELVDANTVFAKRIVNEATGKR